MLPLELKNPLASNVVNEPLLAVALPIGVALIEANDASPPITLPLTAKSVVIVALFALRPYCAVKLPSSKLLYDDSVAILPYVVPVSVVAIILNASELSSQ